ncbi:MAG TPA: TonB-dependent receptor plug domain-containing protein, partial [Chitinophagaceae bacterium]|nr:TonB-dependent receptor plug domain-containing protein [Chitinophagaceae bacterium]
MKKNKLVNQLICRFMRIGLLPLLLVNCMAVVIYANPSSGQEVLNRKVNLVAEQKEVRTILAELSRLADIKFVYSAQRIPTRKKVDLYARDKKLGEVLDNLLLPLNIFYHASGDQIVLMRRGDDGNEVIELKEDPSVKADNADNAVKPITGKVVSEGGDPLSGVSIVVRGTSRGTTTNAAGAFSISVDVGETLEFSIIGFKSYSIKVGSDNNLTIQMVSDISKLNEIVVVGYGTQRRSNVTGAIASVSSKTIAELPVASVEQALQGRVAGLTVTNNGSPGTSPIVAIRGISSINFSSTPLYVIDGFPTGNLANFDSRDIEGVEVLKDASAAAIYGSRATNGVIIITTKKGRRDGRLKVNYDSYVGTQKVWKKIDLLNTSQYLLYERALNGNAYPTPIAMPPRLQSANFNQPIFSGATQTFAQTNTDWQ